MTKHTESLKGINSNEIVDLVLEVPVTIQVITKNGGPCTKTIGLSDEGSIVKNASDCWVSTGTVESRTITLGTLPDLITSLNSNQALSLCNVNFGNRNLVSKNQAHQYSDALTRTRKDMPWGEDTALLLIDVDTSEQYNPSDIEEVLADIETVLPGFHHAAKVIVPSTSSHLSTKEGHKLTESGNFHIYVIVKNSAELPPVKSIRQRLESRFFLSGKGYYAISKAGTLLPRGPLDAAVFSPERLIFEADPILEDGLVQKRPEAKFIPGGYLDPKVAFAPLSQSDQWESDRKKSKCQEERTPEACEVRRQWEINRAENLADDKDITLEQAKATVSKMADNVVTGDALLHFAGVGGVETVPAHEVIANPAQYDGHYLADPIEPDYGSPGRINTSKAVLNARLDFPLIGPMIWSFAHGGQAYKMCHSLESLKKVISRIDNNQYKEIYRHWPLLQVETEVEKGIAVEMLCEVLKPAGKRQVTKDLKDAEDAFNDQLDRYREQRRAETSETQPGGDAGTETTKPDVSANETLESLLETHVYVDGIQPSVINLNYRKSALVQSNHAFLAGGRNNSRMVQQNKKKTVRELWYESTKRKEVKAVGFCPDQDLLYSQNGKLNLNLWEPPICDGDPTHGELFAEHIRRVVPDPVESTWLLGWFAHILQKPGERPDIAPLLYTPTRGTGRGLIAQMMGAILGSYARVVMTSELDGQFNEYLDQTLLVTFEEAAEGSDPRTRNKMSANIRNMITAKEATINNKYGLKYVINVYARFMFQTNIQDALAFDAQERRIYAITCTRDAMSEKAAEEFVEKMKDEEFRHGVAAYLKLLDISDLQVFGHAPATELKLEMARAGDSPISADAKILLESWPYDIVSFSYVRDKIECSLGWPRDRAKVEWQVAHAFREEGWRSSGKQCRVAGEDNPIRVWFRDVEAKTKWSNRSGVEIGNACRGYEESVKEKEKKELNDNEARLSVESAQKALDDLENSLI